jgi:hypothetical protein
MGKEKEEIILNNENIKMDIEGGFLFKFYCDVCKKISMGFYEDINSEMEVECINCSQIYKLSLKKFEQEKKSL